MTVAEEQRRDWSRKAKTVAVVVAFAVMGTAGGWLGVAIRNTQTDVLRSAIYGQCHRQNLKSVTGNRNNYSSYKLWGSLLTLLQFSATQPTATNAKPNPRVTVLYDAFLSSMKDQLRSLSWTPLSNCEQATNNPHYLPPVATPFVQQLPPLSAFTIGPNE